MLLKRVDEPNAALQTITLRPSLIPPQSTKSPRCSMNRTDLKMTIRDYAAWVRDRALPFWLAVNGFDPQTGFFFEKLHLEMALPTANADLRVRTHMRQVYVFAHSALLGLVPGGPALEMARTAMAAIRKHAGRRMAGRDGSHRLTQHGAGRRCQARSLRSRLCPACPRLDGQGDRR